MLDHAVRPAARVRRLAVTAFALAAALLAGATQARATLSSATLSFTGASWSDGGSLSGSFTYTYNTANSLQSITAADIVVTAGSTLPAYNLVYNEPGKTDTASAPGFDDNDSTHEHYEMYLSDLATGNIQVYLDWNGTGSAAVLEISVPGNYSSETDGNVSGAVLGLTSAGTSTDILPSVPEPAGLLPLFAGLAGIALVRSRRLACPAGRWDSKRRLNRPS
jgi:hypothetical protein